MAPSPEGRGAGSRREIITGSTAREILVTFSGNAQSREAGVASEEGSEAYKEGVLPLRTVRTPGQAPETQCGWRPQDGFSDAVTLLSKRFKGTRRHLRSVQKGMDTDVVNPCVVGGIIPGRN